MGDRFAQARAAQGWATQRRRALHRHPEVGLALPDTHDAVVSELEDLGYAVEHHPSAGVTVRIPGHSPDGVTSVLRADMDALPVTERTGLEFASERPGAMHACGHDLHMAMLLASARVLAEYPPACDTVLAFQPGEESDRGAVATLEHANLRLTEPATAFAVHVHATEDPGVVLHRPGVFMAFGDWFTIELEGPGAHASQPHLAGNPVVAAAEITTAVGDLVVELAVKEPLVATITEVLIGNAVNVIAATGRMRGTIRTLDSGQRDLLIVGMKRVVAEVASCHGLRARFSLIEGYPAVMNDGDYHARMVSRLSEGELRSRIRTMPAPSMVIEDFAYFLQRWPGTMVYIGARGAGNTSFNHADDVVFDESALEVGTALYLLAADGF